MILVDTSIWIDHFSRADADLASLLERRLVVMHPFVIGELALGNWRTWRTVLRFLQNLPQARVASDHEVLFFIDAHRLSGLGIGYVDAHLLASVLLLGDASLWTRDKRLNATAVRLSVAAGSPK